jgi:hypothetical protein
LMRAVNAEASPAPDASSMYEQDLLDPPRP